MATISFQVPDAVVPRIQTAVGRLRGLGRDATLPEVQQELKNWLKGVVTDQETATQHAAITVPDTGL